MWLTTQPALIAWHMHLVAVGFVAFQLSGSAISIGIVGVCVTLPMVLLSLAGGVVADRFPRGVVLQTTNAVHATTFLALALLAYAGALEVWHLAAIGTVQGTAFAFGVPARYAFIGTLAGPEHARNAVALNSAGLTTARIVGPSIAGVLLAVSWIGAGGLYLLLSLTYAGVALGLRRLGAGTVPVDASRGSSWERLIEGLRAAATSPALRVLLLLAFLPFLVGLRYQALMPLVAEGILGVGPVGLGVLLAAIGLGSLAGSLVAAGLHRAGRPAAVQTLCGLTFGAALVVFSLVDSFALAALVAFIAGAASGAFSTLNGALLIANTEERLYGRVMALYVLVQAIIPLGTLPAAWLADAVGVQATILATGVGVLSTVAAVALAYRPYRSIGWGARAAVPET